MVKLIRKIFLFAEQANTENDDENGSSEVNIVVTAPQDSLLYAITEDEEQAQNENVDNSIADHRHYPEATHGPYGLSEQELSVLSKNHSMLFINLFSFFL